MLQIIRITKVLPPNLTLTELVNIYNNNKMFIGFERKNNEIYGIIAEIILTSDLNIQNKN